MRRLAAHYIWYHEILPLHYLELRDDGAFIGVYPLTEEVESTVFYDGVLIPALSDGEEVTLKSAADWPVFTRQIEDGCLVTVYQLTGLSTAAAKLGTGDSAGNCHIKRL